ncbi:MAG: DUF4227 family protein [Bacillaceae bacterium]
MNYAKSIVEMIKVFIVFITCTILFYVTLLWINEEYQYYRRYQQPDDAVKVQHIPKDRPMLIDRMIYFYENGE